jgi:hypothetical protein
MSKRQLLTVRMNGAESVSFFFEQIPNSSDSAKDIGIAQGIRCAPVAPGSVQSEAWRRFDFTAKQPARQSTPPPMNKTIISRKVSSCNYAI